MVISEVFGELMPSVPPAGHATLLEGLQTGISEKLAPLDDPGLDGHGAVLS
jgi:hypothetical protein